MQIQLGCLNRPWYQFTLEEALAGIAGAGYKYAGFTGQQGKPVLSADSSDDDIAGLRHLLGSHGLEGQVVIAQPDLSLGIEEAVGRFQREMERARQLGLRYIILTGSSAGEGRHEEWYSAIELCLGSAHDHEITLLLKPHGGISALAPDLLRALDRLSHPSFGICYDPGNIYYYTGQKAEEDLPLVAEHVRAMCIKDEEGGKHGEVAITPGTGLVDFERIFSILSEVGFSGPCWVECLGGSTVEEINAEAGKTYRFISDIVGAL